MNKPPSRKGCIPWNKGLKGYLAGRTETAEANLKRSLKLKGRNNYWLKGKHRSEETKRKLSATKIGNLNPMYGKKLTEVQLEKKRKSMPRGEKHHNWKGGISKERDLIKKTREYKQWRLAVFKRDCFTCRYCLKIGGALEAHHILSFAKSPEHRFNINNGLTLCLKCHKLFHKNYNLEKECDDENNTKAK